MTNSVATSTPTSHANSVDSLFGDEKLETIIEETDQTDNDVSPERSPSVDVTSTSETILVGNVNTSHDNLKKSKKAKVKRTTDSGGTTEAMPQPPPALYPANMIPKKTYASNSAAVANQTSVPRRTQQNENEERRVDPCAGIDGTHVKQPLKRTIFSRLADEKFKVRRIQRKAPEPSSFKTLQPKTTRTSDLRQRLVQNEDVVAHSSISEEYMRKYKKLPFRRAGVIQFCYEKLRETLGKVKKRKRSVSKSRSTSKRKGKSRRGRNKQKRTRTSRD